VPPRARGLTVGARTARSIAPVLRLVRTVSDWENTSLMQTYQVRTGRRRLALIQAATPQHALYDYARSMGCKDDEVMKLSPDAVSWRGAVYKADLVPDPPPAARSSK
jgi:hypothetical protein